ncbi:MAG: IPT/TIG domain-containing protein [Candidatus Atribacteria bacterium]|nr:IPT/TIG domain-containing protein [Candidatus Atribacteria bacterium]
MKLKNSVVLIFSVFLVMSFILGCTTPAPTPTPTPTPTPQQHPNISSIRYDSDCIKAGTQLKIYGRNFGDIKGTNTVTMNGIVASVSYWSDDEIIAVVPTSSLPARELRVAVTVNGIPSDEYWLYGICATPTPTPTTPTPTPIPLERVDVARNIAIAKAHDDGVNVPLGVHWIKSDVSFGIGSKHYQYTYYGAQSWLIDITYPVVEQPDFTVDISSWGIPLWSGMVYYWETVPLL